MEEEAVEARVGQKGRKNRGTRGRQISRLSDRAKGGKAGRVYQVRAQFLRADLAAAGEGEPGFTRGVEDAEELREIIRALMAAPLAQAGVEPSLVVQAGRNLVELRRAGGKLLFSDKNNPHLQQVAMTVEAACQDPLLFAPGGEAGATGDAGAREGKIRGRAGFHPVWVAVGLGATVAIQTAFWLVAPSADPMAAPKVEAMGEGETELVRWAGLYREGGGPGSIELQLESTGAYRIRRYPVEGGGPVEEEAGQATAIWLDNAPALLLAENRAVRVGRGGELNFYGIVLRKQEEGR